MGHSQRHSTGYALSLNLARHPWLARIVLRLLWRPASQRYARRSNAHTDAAPPQCPQSLRVGRLSREVKRSTASHDRDKCPVRSAVHPGSEQTCGTLLKFFEAVLCAVLVYMSRFEDLPIHGDVNARRRHLRGSNCHADIEHGVGGLESCRSQRAR